MIERDFCDAERPEAVRFSHGDFGFVVQSLDDAARERLAGAKIVEQQFAVRANRANEFLHRFNARTHDFTCPLVEEFGGPGGRGILPEALERFLMYRNSTVKPHRGMNSKRRSGSRS